MDTIPRLRPRLGPAEHRGSCVNATATGCRKCIRHGSQGFTLFIGFLSAEFCAFHSPRIGVAAGVLNLIRQTLAQRRATADKMTEAKI